MSVGVSGRFLRGLSLACPWPVPGVCPSSRSNALLIRPLSSCSFSSSLWRLASRPPLRLTSENEDGEVVVDRPRVMAAVWGPGDAQVCGCVGGEEGGLGTGRRAGGV